MWKDMPGGTTDGADRRPPPIMKAERQAAFNKRVRNELLQHGRERRDAERRRMEEYRRLCKAEGIHSNRLEEYDSLRTAAAKSLDEKLQSIDYDQSLSNVEKRKRKFNLKRNYAAQSVTELLEKKEKHHNALTRVAQFQKSRQEAIEAAKASKRNRETMKNNRIRQRKADSTRYARRTRKGQPVMEGRVEALLDKLQREQRKS